jgi:hypothetical protein
MYYAINYFLGVWGGGTATVTDMIASCVPTHTFNVTFWDTHSGFFEKNGIHLQNFTAPSAHIHSFTSDMQTYEDFYRGHEDSQTFTGKTVVHISSHSFNMPIYGKQL